MKCNQLTTAILMVGLPALTFAAPQQPGSAPKQEPARPAATTDVAYYAPVSKLIGANVWSRAGADGGDRKDLADINDFIVDAETGKVDFVILSSGGVGKLGDNLRRVNYSDLKITHEPDGDCKVMMEVSEDDFGKIAKIEEKSLEPYKAKTVAASARGQAGTREAAGDKPAAGAREAQMRASGAILASELDDFDVRAAVMSYDADGKPVKSDKLGSIDEAWLNTQTGKIEYLTFENKDRKLVFPHRVLMSHVDGEAKSIYFVAPPADRLATAPAIDDSKKLDLRNAEFRRTVDTYYAKGASGSGN